MKRILALLLALTISGDAVHFNELLKFPFLIQHYCEHRGAHPGDSVADFVYKHYVVNQHPESARDSRSDAKLPFKSSPVNHAGFSLFVYTKSSNVSPVNNASVTFPPFHEVSICAVFMDIWQPPKLV